MLRTLSVVAALTTAVSTAVAGCGAAIDVGARPERTGCVEAFDPAVDYFPDKSTVLDAVNFRLQYRRNYQVLTVVQPHPGGEPARYVLVRCGTPVPALTGELTGATVVTVPVASLYSASTTQLGMLAEIDRTGVITGVADPAAVVDPGLRARIGSGALTGYAPGGQVDVETVLGARPDVLVTGGLDEPAYAKLRDGGIPVLADAEWLERTPLGRAEWVKVLAALTGTERRAATAYDAVRAGYRDRVAAVADADPRPVLPGSMYAGVWSMPGGDSYAGRLIRDAGGNYPWADTPGPASRPLNFETVYAGAGQFPLWLVGQEWATVTDAVAEDPRYAELAAVRDGQVWSAVGGPGSDYWERGPARPDLILADLVAILHPQRAPGHRFEFYRRVRR